MLRSAKSTQRSMRQLELIVDGTGTASLSGPASHQATLTDNGTGDYTITFRQAYAQTPVAQVTMVTAVTQARIHAASASAVQIKTFALTDGTTATDADFHLLIIGSDVADKH